MGHRNWLLLEAADHAGGLASSVRDAAGFTWDLGGHVVFSHFGEFDLLLEEVMGEDVLHHDRSSYVRFGASWVPYPFQHNLRHLPAPVQEECLEGLAGAPGGEAGMDFASWIRAVFGAGIARHFMYPYNLKVWATPPEEMSSDWIADRVPVVDYERALRNVREGRDDVAWGPNNRFVFPARGGTGEIYRRLAARLAPGIRFGSRVVEVDADLRAVRLRSGEQLPYDALVSTIPLTQLVAAVPRAPPALRSAAAELHHNGVLMVGVGYEGPLADKRSWMYFPESSTPFYRVTNFAKYAAANVPEADTARFGSLMTETSFSEHRPQQRDGLQERVIDALRRDGLMPASAPVASVHVERIELAYPVPTLGRDGALAAIQPWLMERKILSRGRFGAWRYELGNMDHAVKMGIDAARLAASGTPEELWRHPSGALSQA